MPKMVSELVADQCFRKQPSKVALASHTAVGRVSSESLEEESDWWWGQQIQRMDGTQPPGNVDHDVHCFPTPIRSYHLCAEAHSQEA